MYQISSSGLRNKLNLFAASATIKHGGYFYVGFNGYPVFAFWAGGGVFHISVFSLLNFSIYSATAFSTTPDMVPSCCAENIFSFLWIFASICSVIVFFNVFTSFDFIYIISQNSPQSGTIILHSRPKPSGNSSR